MSAPLARAGWKLPALVDALARAGWGVLAGRQGGAVRSILRALAQSLPAGSASGLITANQLADMSGNCSRWTRSSLVVLERAGIITWTRGGIIDGRPAPSLIRVSKRAIASLVNHARRQHEGTLRGRAASFARRLADELDHRTLIRRQPATKQPPRRQRRNSPLHAELSATHLPLRGRDTAHEAPRITLAHPRSMLSPDWTPPPITDPDKPRGANRLRAALRKKKQ